jgi:glycosyltransferase 2 family protein
MRHAGRFLRIAVTAGLLAFVISRVDLRDMWDHLRVLDPRLIALGYLLHLGMVALNAWRWQMLVQAQGTRVGLGRLLSYYFVGIFFNTFTPTSIGGDVTRVIDLSRHTGRRSTALASIMVERIIGLFVLLPVSLFGLAAAYSHIQSGRSILLYLEALLVAVLLAAFALVRVDRARGLLARVPVIGPLVTRPGVARRVANVQEALDVYGGRGALLWSVFVISVASRVVWILSCWVFGIALGVRAPLASYFLVISLVEVARMVPISLSGLGIRETAVVALFGLFGVPAAAALALSILIYAPFLVNGLLGGGIYALRGRSAPAPAAAGASASGALDADSDASAAARSRAEGAKRSA